jgi:hypothetical protein
VYCISIAGTPNSALLVPPTSIAFVYCMLIAGTTDAGLALLREVRLPNQNASPVSAIAPTAPIAAPAIQVCGLLLPGVVVVVATVALDDVEEMDEVADEIGEAFEEVEAMLEETETTGNAIVGPAKGVEDVLEEKEEVDAEVDELVVEVTVKKAVTVGLEGLKIEDVVIAAVGRVRYNVISGPPCAHKKTIVEGPPPGEVWYIDMDTHPRSSPCVPLYHYLLAKYVSYLSV